MRRGTYDKSGWYVGKCDACSKFGAREHVHDLGPDGHGGRQRRTVHLCAKCEPHCAECKKGTALLR